MGEILKDIGNVLYTARKHKGLSLEEVAGTLKIRRLYLKELEAGEVTEIPGQVYYLGYVKEYSAFLGLDSKTMVAQCQQDKAFQETPCEPENKKWRWRIKTSEKAAGIV